MHFSHLRTTPFEPTFEWVATTKGCADRINRPHEDYPKRVDRTEWMLGLLPDARWIIDNARLLTIHEFIFADKGFAGEFRDIGVIVGLHKPPHFEKVIALMDELEGAYKIKNVWDLVEWYKDFETIHPFQDGNGRVGGVIVASYAHRLHPEKGWLAPNQ